MSEKKNLGFIGVGLMGHGLAKNLMKHGHTMTLHEHAGNQPMEDLVGMGARTAKTPREVAQGADVVFMCVTGSPQVEACVYGPDGLLEGLGAGAIVVDATTADPVSTAKVAAAVQARGGRYVDAPMTRTSQHAEDGNVNAMLGGDPDTIAQVRPLAETYTENIFVGGGVGSGHRMKLLHKLHRAGHAGPAGRGLHLRRQGGRRPPCADPGARHRRRRQRRPEAPAALPGQRATGQHAVLAGERREGPALLHHMAEDLQVGAFVGEAVHQTFMTAANVGGDEKMIPELLNILCGMHGAPLCGQ